ncbi:MAG: Fe3+-citrate ABC transporter substrate-binding protein [Lachnospiraceae bacterium]|nr:Fe3+-citrate ABC transporter substrate-binding protein [Lachnospiraceae bacterium]
MKKIISLLLAAMMIISLTACGDSNGKESDSGKDDGAESGFHMVTDHNGYEVKVPDEIDRIVVCDILPLSSVLTVFFDSAEIVAGMSDTAMAAAKNGLLGELYPEILNAKTGFIEGSTVNTEELMKLEPDVVIYNAANAELGEQLRNAGFAAIAVSVNKWEYDCIETLNQWVALLSEISPENGKTEVVETKSKEMYDFIQERVGTIPEEERERVFFLYKYSDTAIETSGKKFFGQWWADAAGAVNVGEEMTTDNSVVVNMEQIYTWNPSAIFITNFTSAGPEDLYNNTVGNYNWSTIDAVKNQRVYKMPLGMYRSYTPGADTPVTLLWMAQTLYPELFADIDIVKVAMDYYKDLFGVTLTKEQAASIFAPAGEAGAGF